MIWNSSQVSLLSSTRIKKLLDITQSRIHQKKNWIAKHMNMTLLEKAHCIFL
jgi:hypothetical protein